MSRAELWKALADATDAVQAAGDEYTRASTPQARAAMDAAFREYVRRLTPVIGTAAASSYEASLASYEEVLDRVEALNATLSVLPSMDDADRTLSQQLTEEQAAAGEVFERARVALDAALERAVEQPRPGWLCDLDDRHIVWEAPGGRERRSVMDDDLESFLTDPLERRLLTAFRSLVDREARVSVVRTVERWLALERAGVIMPDTTKGGA